MKGDKAIIKLDFTGDIAAAWELKKSLVEDIEIGYFTDWLRLLRASATDPSLENSAPDVVAWAVANIRFSRRDERQLQGALNGHAFARAGKMSPARGGAAHRV